MLILKFGGTSVGSAQRILAVADIIRANLDRKPVVVLSAMSGVTDSLVVATNAAARRDDATVATIVRDLREKHHTAAQLCVDDSLRPEVVHKIDEYIDTLARILAALSLLQEASPRSRDLVASYGEKLSTTLLHATLTSQGIPSEILSAEAVIKTDDNFGEAMPLMEQTATASRQLIPPLIKKGIVPIVPGFTGSTVEGITTTLGRGGSDYTATILGAVLDADEVWIYTDTDGVLTADPKVVPNARPISHLSYAEARELSFFGAKVIHPRTVLPAIDHGFPIRVLNSFNPCFAGTIITAEGERTGQPVKSIAYTRNVCIVTVEGSGRPGGPRVAGRTLNVLERLSTDAFLTNASSPEQNLSFVLPTERANAIVRELTIEFADEIRRGEIRRIDMQDHLGVFSCVGEGLGETSGIGARVFTVLGKLGISVHGFAQAPSGTSFSFVVDSEQLDEAVRGMHEEFIGNMEPVG